MGMRREDFEKIYTIDELVKGEEILFVATGVTEGDLLKGVVKNKEEYETQSIVFSTSDTKPKLIRKNIKRQGSQ